ncbi:MAG: 3-isopropylmalate dehydratase small subunit [Elusimicrobia bacterium RIFOXYC2_FULL_34_12]|nr:MAG: 3-isopropylmalate dehydratase small subunit [Elusimicrobia bacterium RIFOXYC2_FULL_34_12]OGS38964.1 MAG: 3-isopropylmalate dehydratase small subunit [Elusimicrobia bacterium RIFOXYD2_FULL_34_30]HAM39563.1 3-isopropylmalate dehydratase small subunit [Elusimicrobiota bacterium]
MILKGKVHKYGDDVNTDEIIPARYLNTINPEELAKHCMEDIDKEFVKKVSSRDVIVAGKNFGCGSSREHAPLCIKAVGVSCVIAESFARIFFRNAINIGLPILESKEASNKIKNGDELEINIKEGKIKNLTSHQTYSANPFPDFLLKIISSDGLLKYIKR